MLVPFFLPKLIALQHFFFFLKNLHPSMRHTKLVFHHINLFSFLLHPKTSQTWLWGVIYNSVVIVPSWTDSKINSLISACVISPRWHYQIKICHLRRAKEKNTELSFFFPLWDPVFAYLRFLGINTLKFSERKSTTRKEGMLHCVAFVCIYPHTYYIAGINNSITIINHGWLIIVAVLVVERNWGDALLCSSDVQRLLCYVYQFYRVYLFGDVWRLYSWRIYRFRVW